MELLPPPGGHELPTCASIRGEVIHADAPAAGRFSCSSELYNKIYALIRWAQLNNMVSVMTDCPTREKLGWLEEDHLNGPALRYNFDLPVLMTKMVADMADSQRANGMVPSTCPDYLRHPDNNHFVNPPEWGSACILVPWQQYAFDGDERAGTAGRRRITSCSGNSTNGCSAAWPASGAIRPGRASRRSSSAPRWSGI